MSAAENIFLKEDGKLNLKGITAEMINHNIEFKINRKSYFANQFKENLENSKGTLFKMIKYIVARYLLTFDKKTYLVYKFLRYYGKYNPFQYTKNDWYKYYFTITAIDDIDK